MKLTEEGHLMKLPTPHGVGYALLAAALAPVMLVYSGAPASGDIAVHAVATLAVGVCVLAMLSAQRPRGRGVVWGLLLALWVWLLLQRWWEVRGVGAAQLLFIGLGLPRAFALWSTISLPIYFASVFSAWRHGTATRMAVAVALVWFAIVGLNRFPASTAPDVSPWPSGTASVGFLYLVVLLPVPIAAFYFALRRGGIEKLSNPAEST